MDDGDGMRDRKAARSLGRIARSLNVPVESFYGPDWMQAAPGPDGVAPETIVAQLLEVMRLLLPLEDPEARARLVAFIARHSTLDG